MKKFLFAVMMAALAIPMMNAQLDATKAGVMRSTDRTAVINTTPMKGDVFGKRLKAEMMRGTILFSEDFEGNADGWGAYDYDGDGNNWGFSTGTYSLSPHSGNYCLESVSYSYNTGALDPDNWLISPDITLNGTLSIWAANRSSSFPDNFTVYVCVGELTSLDDFVAISGTCTPGTSWIEYTFDLTPYAGQVGCFAIRHWNSENMFSLFVDDISIYLDEVADVPENLTVATEKITPTTAKATWEDNTNAAWNLRYRPLVEGVENNIFWGFDEGNNGNEDISLTGGWTSIDADGDGNDWYILNDTENTIYSHHGGIGFATSASYAGGVLYPDNWLISPEFMLDGTLKFWANGQDTNDNHEVFCVYVSTDLQNWEPLSGDITTPGRTPTQYTFDLSGFEGAMGYLAFRHYNCSDQFRLNIDDIEIVYVEEPEWIYVENLDETGYLIEGLTPETTYEVQVQGINPNGVESDWTESVIFTTPAEEVVIEKTPTPEISVEEKAGETWEDHGYYEVTIEAEEGDIEYRILLPDGTWTEWISYDGAFIIGNSTEAEGEYLIEARAKAENKEYSDVAEKPIIVTPRTAVNELNGDKAVAGVRYFNAIGQEMAQPNGMTIVVTTYTDGTKSATKVIK